MNQWVVGDNWLDAEATIALLPRFDVQIPATFLSGQSLAVGGAPPHEPGSLSLIREA
ncbi:MAG: hypothetical protein R3E51_21805 [Rhizobiaceae bacterium]